MVRTSSRKRKASAVALAAAESAAVAVEIKKRPFAAAEYRALYAAHRGASAEQREAALQAALQAALPGRAPEELAAVAAKFQGYLQQPGGDADGFAALAGGEQSRARPSPKPSRASPRRSPAQRRKKRLFPVAQIDRERKVPVQRATVTPDAGLFFSRFGGVQGELTERGCAFMVFDTFYSGIDMPFFSFAELRDALQHGDGIAQQAKLRKKELQRHRRRLAAQHGAPRRFSAAFVVQERLALRDYRQQVRQMIASGGIDEDSGARNPAVLSVGQRVMALHPYTAHPQLGYLLTVEPGQVRVQFEHQDLGVILVPDTGVMPFKSDHMEMGYSGACGAEAGALDDFAEESKHAIDIRVPAKVIQLLRAREKLLMDLRALNAQAEALSPAAPTAAQKSQATELIGRLRASHSQLEVELLAMRRYTSRSTTLPLVLELKGQGDRVVLRELYNTANCSWPAQPDSRFGGLSEAEMQRLMDLIAACVTTCIAAQRCCILRQHAAERMLSVLDELKPAPFAEGNFEKVASIRQALDRLKAKLSELRAL